MSNAQTLISQKTEIEKQLAEINRQLAEAKSAERKAVIAKIKETMTANGLTVEDIFSGKSPMKVKPGSTDSRQTVKAKYKDPTTGNTWSGRGLTPKWLVAHIEAGKTKEDFLI